MKKEEKRRKLKKMTNVLLKHSREFIDGMQYMAMVFQTCNKLSYDEANYYDRNDVTKEKTFESEIERKLRIYKEILDSQESVMKNGDVFRIQSDPYQRKMIIMDEEIDEDTDLPLYTCYCLQNGKQYMFLHEPQYQVIQSSMKPNISDMEPNDFIPSLNQELENVFYGYEIDTQEL